MAEAIPISILAKISEYLVAPIGRQLSYLFQLSGNVETLKNELENLGKLRADVEPKVRAAENNVETISNEVTAWLNRVSLVEGEAQIIVEDKNRFPKGCLSGWLLNIKSRHGLRRRAKKITPKIVTLQEEGRFTDVAIPAPLLPYTSSTYTAFDSREVILNEIIKGLKDKDINMIGICGMGGVGKTTMNEEVLKRVKKENMFDDYAETVVSQKPDMVKVQRDIAQMLDLKLEEDIAKLRAGKLNQRLKGKKVLIILDDVWEEFDFQSLGITLESSQRGCKIVFTSRTQGLWREFESRRCELSLYPLTFNESWNLFKENIGVLPDDEEFVSVAQKIVRECAGLPLALVTLGKALRGKCKQAWKDTLLKLEKTLGGQPKVYESIRQSYDYLDDEEAKSLFLLCSLFEEDSEIFVESLVNMGMGLRLFEGINIVEEARDRVFTLVEHLQSRSLVTKKEAYITVHDVVRDVSKRIASTENGSLVLEQGVTWERSLDKISPENCTRISIISNEIIELPSQSQFPNLELLRCSNKCLQRIPDICFEGMAKLQVLDINRSFNHMERSYVGSWTVLKLPSSLQSLTNLHTLCLQDFRLEDFTAIKYLQNLEILRITDNHIEELPKEIGQLTKLRLLDMLNCRSLKRISPGIISCLTVLEELYLGGHKEFESWSNLYILHIVIKDPSLLHHSEALRLNGESTKSLVCELVREASQSIKYLVISETETPEYLANAMDCTKAPFLVFTLESLKLKNLNNLKQIINGPLVSGNFAKLKKLDVSECKQLRNIFRLSTEELKFDLCDQEFGEFALPEALASLPSTSFLVSTLSGSLSLVFYNAFMRNLATDHMSCCTIWVMRDSGNVDLWEQIYKINLDGGLGMVSAIRRCGDILLSTDSVEVVSFNCEDGMVSSTGICGAKSSFFVNEYVESLVLLGKEEEVNGINPQDNRRRRKCIFARILARFFRCLVQWLRISF